MYTSATSVTMRKTITLTVTGPNNEHRRFPGVARIHAEWQGKGREHTRCKNFQFAVSAFGYPPHASNA
jgi:hypothetical protein